MEPQITQWRTFALVALVLYVAGLLVAFGWRAWLQYRRTGDWGIRRGSPAEPLAGRLGRLLFVAALGACLAGLALGIVLPSWRLPLPDGWAWVGVALCVVGLVAVIASQLAMGASWRVGVDPSERTDLVTHGPFAVVRNPIFSAMGVMLTGLALMVPTVALAAALAAFIAGVQLQVRVAEEPYLVATHGEAYLAYARRTGRFVPWLGRL